MSGEPPKQAPSNFGNGGNQLEGILRDCSKFSEKARRCHILQVRCPLLLPKNDQCVGVLVPISWHCAGRF